MNDDSGRTTVTRDWRHRARCRGEDPDTLFVQGAQQRDVREVCKACPVRTECLAHALDNRIRFGVWGGMTERERRALLKRRPDVVSWAALLEAARRAAMQPRQPAAEAPAPRRPASGEGGATTGGPTARRGDDRRVG
ncbi:MAG: WhiB family transcriptional regulator, redox-sensing transcriptional regulator [Actinomycetota bacterium]|nr:WhiB family transcriptional regulator, redox-sensing transcriptional regulator [Actinomycetota bacterium]